MYQFEVFVTLCDNAWFDRPGLAYRLGERLDTIGERSCGEGKKDTDKTVFFERVL